MQQTKELKSRGSMLCVYHKSLLSSSQLLGFHAASESPQAWFSFESQLKSLVISQSYIILARSLTICSRILAWAVKDMKLPDREVLQCAHTHTHKHMTNAAHTHTHSHTHM